MGTVIAPRVQKLPDARFQAAPIALGVPVNVPVMLSPAVRTKTKPTPKRTKPPLTRVPGRTNTPPKRTSAPALLRAAPLEGGPEIDKSTVKPRNTPKTKTDRKFVPKTTPKPKKTKPPLKKAPPRKTAPATGPVTNESFGKAFRRNRNSGNATFMWRGNKYTTRYKEETIAQHKKKFGVEGKY